jgi:hypothetical protein
MKKIFTLCLAFTANFCFGQFGIIYDKDAVCNVRSSPQKGDNIIDRLKNGHLLYCFETNNNWTNIDYSKNQKRLNGQVYKDRIILVSAYQSIPVLTKGKLNIVLKKDSIKIIVTEQKFEKKQHKLSFFKEYKDQLEFIDNKNYWGTDGGIPKTEYQAIEVFIGTRKINLPKKALENLYEISLLNTQVNYDKANDILYIQSMNSDGAGSYEVIWKVEKGIYKDRLIAYGF